MVEDIKTSNKEYRGEIREQLAAANNGIQGVNTNIQESIKQNALVQHSIIGLQKEFERNEKSHEKFWAELRDVKSELNAKANAKDVENIKGKGVDWLWDALKMLIVSGLSILGAKLLL